MTPHTQGERAAEQGRVGIPPLELETDAECEAWLNGYYRVKHRQLAETAFRMMSRGS